VADLSGIQMVLLEIEGSNQTMTNLGGGTWCYIGWTPSSVGTYLYTIYIQDNVGNWQTISGSIQIFTTTPAPSLDWLIWLLSFVIVGMAIFTGFLYRRLNKKIQNLSSPKAIPPKDLPKKIASQ
jgi:hypothetical protein